ncbi:MAG: hypothetical protein WCP28_02940 [Actinomycetes bacterium]
MMAQVAPQVRQTQFSEVDLSQVSWHDNAVHAFAFEPEPSSGTLMLDIDHIVQWIKPVGGAEAYSFWICPATLVLPDAFDLKLNVDPIGYDLAIVDCDVDGPDDRGIYTWGLVGNYFELRLRSTGFRQYLRRPPTNSTRQRLAVAERGGISFDCRTFDADVVQELTWDQ